MNNGQDEAESCQDLDSLFKRGIRLPIATRLTLSFLSIIILSSLIFTIVGVQIISSLIVNEAEERVRNDLNTARLIYTDTLDQCQPGSRVHSCQNLYRRHTSDKRISPRTYVDELKSLQGE